MGLFDRFKNMFANEPPPPPQKPTHVMQYANMQSLDMKFNEIADNWDKVAKRQDVGTNKEYTFDRAFLAGGFKETQDIHNDIEDRVNKEIAEQQKFHDNLAFEPINWGFDPVEKAEILNEKVNEISEREKIDKQLQAIQALPEYHRTLGDLQKTGMSVMLDDKQLSDLRERFNNNIRESIENGNPTDNRAKLAILGLSTVKDFGKENLGTVLQAEIEQKYRSAVKGETVKEISPYKKLLDETIKERENYVKTTLSPDKVTNDKDFLALANDKGVLKGKLAEFVDGTKVTITDPHIQLATFKSHWEKSIKPQMNEINNLVKNGEKLSGFDKDRYAEMAGFKNFLDTEIRKDKISDIERIVNGNHRTAQQSGDLSDIRFATNLRYAPPEVADKMIAKFEQEVNQGKEVGLAEHNFNEQVSKIRSDKDYSLG